MSSKSSGISALQCWYCAYNVGIYQYYIWNFFTINSRHNADNDNIAENYINFYLPQIPTLKMPVLYIYIYIYIWNLNLVITALAECLAAAGATPSEGTVLTEKLTKFQINFSGYQWVSIMDRMMSFKMADEISQNLTAHWVLTLYMLNYLSETNKCIDN